MMLIRRVEESSRLDASVRFNEREHPRIYYRSRVHVKRSNVKLVRRRRLASIAYRSVFIIFIIKGEEDIEKRV